MKDNIKTDLKEKGLSVWTEFNWLGTGNETSGFAKNG
jgi:hypothetical protein